MSKINELEVKGLFEKEEKEVAPEVNESLCRFCGEIKTRKFKGFYGYSKNKRWVNENDELWVGRRCPDCVRLNMKGRMAKSRSKAKEENVQSTDS